MTYSATVVDTYPLTPRVKGFRLRVPDHEFEYDPGQHTTVHFESGDEEVVRPYTPTNLPGTDQLTFAIKRYDDGLASAYMHTRTPGDEVTIGELEGNLGIEDFDRDVAFLATGAGITPMLAMLRHYLAEGTGDATMLFGETDESSLIHRGTLNELAADNPKLDVAFTLSQPNWEWTGRQGYVQEHLESVFDDFESRDFYVCGVPEMVVQTKDRLRELGAPDDRIHSEGWEDDAVTDDT
ncbi:FAD-binding oxidoreductase [Salarchaeum sp. III]|uniref:ferredoxin--NADP reductase n=1 Tax=Salarchaeum sp. III TaxID=3107927 RepID=UPI002ED93172